MSSADFGNESPFDFGPPQVSDSWGGHHALSGDPYLEGDVTRSVCDQLHSSVLEFGAAYGESCGQAEFFTGFGEDSFEEMHRPLGVAGYVAPKEHSIYPSVFDGLAVGRPHQNFEPGHVAPPLPSDPLFRLEVTTVRTHSIAAFEMGNILLELLTEASTVLSLKVKHYKFSIKADILRDGQPCCVKLRVYDPHAAAPQQSTVVGRGQSAELVVEAQRRSGDALAFMSLFRELAEYVRMRCGHTADDVDHPLCVPVAASVPDLAASMAASKTPIGVPEGLGPMVDLASGAGMLPLQLRAELAAGFVRAAQDAQTQSGDALFQGDVISALAVLLRGSSEDEVLFPAAEAVGRWASLVPPLLWPPTSPDAALTALVACSDAVLQKLRAMPASSNVRLELSKALVAAIDRCAHALSACEAHALEAVMHELAPHAIDLGPSVHANVSTALSTLEKRHQIASAKPGLYS